MSFIQHIKFDNEFPSRLLKLRASLGLDRAALARAAGIPYPCLGRWEAGTSRPRPESLIRVAQALSTSTEYLRTGLGPKVTEPASKSIADVIADARKEVARAVGVLADQVRIDIDYSNGV